MNHSNSWILISDVSDTVRCPDMLTDPVLTANAPGIEAVQRLRMYPVERSPGRKRPLLVSPCNAAVAHPSE